MQNKFPQKCLQHEEDCIAIDLNATDDQQNRHCCAKCLINFNNSSTRNMITYNEAQQYLDKHKKVFKMQRQTQILNNSVIIQQLVTNLITIRNINNKTLDQLTEYLNQKIIEYQIQLNQLEPNIQDIDIDSFLSSNHQFTKTEDNIQEIKLSITKILNDLIKQKEIQECLQKTEMIDSQIIPFKPSRSIKDINTAQLKLQFMCPIHNQTIRMFDLNENIAKEDRIICEDCATYKKGPFTKISTFEAKFLDLQEQYQQNFKSNQEQLKNKINSLILLYENIKEEYDNQITKTIKSMKNILSQFSLDTNILSNNINLQDISRNQILEIAELLSQPQQIQELKNQEFQSAIFQFKSEIEEFIIQIRKIEIYLTAQLIPYDLQNKFSLELTNKVEYQLEKKKSIKQIGECYTIAINDNQTIVGTGCDKYISLFRFVNGNLIFQQQLDTQENKTIYITFMKATNNFISLSTDNSFNIWVQIDNLWFKTETVNNINQADFTYLLINQKNDLIITCSDDQNVQLWGNQEQWTCLQTFTEEGEIYSLSANDYFDQFCYCGKYKQDTFDKSSGLIVICNQEKNSLWIVQQILVIEDSIVRRVCYKGIDKIIFQTQSYFGILEKKLSNQHFDFNQKRIVQEAYHYSIFFPKLYIESKQLIICQRGSFINIYRLENKDEFELCQSIDFNTIKIIGTLTNDVQFLITWDSSSGQVQIRRNFMKI